MFCFEWLMAAIPAADSRQVHADGFQDVRAAWWVEIGFRFELLLKTKDRIGFAS
jgi:hypothetical protein